MKKKILILFTAIVSILILSGNSNAIDFKIRGLFQMGFGAGINFPASKASGKAVNSPISNDKFKARQRFRLWLDAVASESLSGTVGIELGHIRWGQASSGGALGADGKIVELRQAYIDWTPPDLNLKIRMGLQETGMPSAAGGSQIFREDVNTAGITINTSFNDNVGLTAGWMRPYNDNYNGPSTGYLDNMDLFFLLFPLKFDTFEITPWTMFGMQGKNTFKVKNDHGGYNYVFTGYDGGNLVGSIWGLPFGNQNQNYGSSLAYGSIIWAGLPIKWFPDPWNFEVDFNYGYAEGMGKYTVEKNWYGIPYGNERASTRREGWLVKGLIEYKMDWVIPGVFGWYASGDDGNLKNGSERIPFIYTRTTYSTLLGDDPALYGGIGGNARSAPYDGTWGVGARLKDISFLPDLKHLLRVTYIEGTNSTSMVKYAKFLSQGVYNPCLAWQGVPGTDDYYLTTNDKFLEFNFQTVWKMYENFSMGIDFAYAINMIDKDTWRKADNTTFSKQDLWIADLKFTYRF